MATLIRRGRICSENWQLLDAATPEAAPAAASADPAVTGVLIPLPAWRDQPARWLSLRTPFGVVLQATDDPGALAPELARIPVIAIQFARFNDGRGYSIGRLLRSRYGYSGELRAIGDVLRDQLFYLKRVGFDAFELRADQDAEAALSAFSDFSESYQGAVEPALPLFRRRVA